MTQTPRDTTLDGPDLHPALLGEGLIATVDELCALRRVAAGLDPTRPARSGALRAGVYRSPFRSRGMEFDEVRAYQPGDDARAIDWRVTARTGRPHSKRFHEDRERPVMLVVDARHSMRFGTRGCFKSVAAARWAALVAWAAHGKAHRVGGLVLSPRGCAPFPPKSSSQAAQALIRELAVATAAEGETGPSLAGSLSELRRHAPVGAQVFVVSDFEDFDDDAEARLLALHARCDVSCVLVYDPLELTAPPAGRYRISDGAQSREVSTIGLRMRERWSRPFLSRRNRLNRFCARHRIPLHEVRTGRAPEVAAFGSLARRRSGRRPR